MIQDTWLFLVVGFGFLWVIETRLRGIQETSRRIVEELEYLNRDRRKDDYAREPAEKYPNLPPID